MIDFATLHQLADSRRQRLPIVAAGDGEPTVLEALRRASDRGWVSPIVAGSEREIRRIAEEQGIDLDGFTVIDTDDPARAAVAEVRAGRAAIVMKGQVATPDLMAAVLDPNRGLRTNRAIGQVVYIEIPKDNRRFLMADTGVMIHPNIAKKIDILRSVVDVAHALGAELPRVALMAASEKVVDAMPETLHAAEIQRRHEQGEITGCVVQGPLSFDLAYASSAADKKRIRGSVVGAADVMIFPDLLSANLTVKAIMYTADCRYGGVLRGTSHPVVFMSRSDTTEVRLNSLALALRLWEAESAVGS
jgi:phosphate butyryltransferase